jgi:heme-degrading monooxygenase HmoA
MVLERALLPVLPGHEEQFEQAIAQARGVVAKAQGFRGMRVLHGIESPQSYLLLIEWDTLEDHMQGFRESDLFGEWRALIGPHFDGTPQVEHYTPLD